MLDDRCNEELGVKARGAEVYTSGTRGAAIARFEVARDGLWDQRSGEGVSVLSAAPTNDDALVPAADKGLGVGRNSTALAFNRRGDESGEEDALGTCCGCGCDSDPAFIYELVVAAASCDTCGRLNVDDRGDVGIELGVSGRFGARRNELVDAREEGREGRFVGVRKRNGTPETSSRCLCISSSTF